MLQQQSMIEVIAQENANAQYHVRTDAKGTPLGHPVFYTELPVCWTRDPEHSIVINAFVWGNEVRTDNPTAEEMGLFALRAAEIKKGDILLLNGRLCGTSDGTLTFTDQQRVVTASNLQMQVQGFAVTGTTESRSLELHPLQQMFFCEAFVGADAKADYTKNNTFFAKFPACWSKGPEEKLWFDATVWGKKVMSDKPTPEEAGSFAAWVAENVKEGDKVLLLGRLGGTKAGQVSLYTKGSEVKASYVDLMVNSLSITDKKANRAVKPLPTESNALPKATATPVGQVPVRQPVSVPSNVTRPSLPVRPSIPMSPSGVQLQSTPKPVSTTANPFAKFKKP